MGAGLKPGTTDSDNTLHYAATCLTRSGILEPCFTNSRGQAMTKTINAMGNYTEQKWTTGAFSGV